MDSHGQDSFAQNQRQERTLIIRELNDRLRVEHAGGQLFVTHKICSLGEAYVPSIIRAVTAFDASNSDNDPYGEHDFGSLEVMGQRIFWKIDYWDEHMKFGSPDPADPDVTTRVLTVMLASEY